MKQCEIDGTLIKAKPYKPIHIESEGEYDADDHEDDTAKFDGMVLHQLMKDYMHAEPALRYQIARNYFERALTTAKVCYHCIIRLSLCVTPREPKISTFCWTKMHPLQW